MFASLLWLPRMKISERCLDHWASDFDAFSYDFLFYCQCYAKAVGYWFKLDGEALKIAHSNWCAQCQLWEKTLVMPDSNGLSHVKMVAILLTELASIDWLGELLEFAGEERDGYEFTGEPAERDDIRRDINGGGGTYLAFEFAIMVLNYFESRRIDREGDFVFRATADVLHDILVYLSSARRDSMSTYLILNALYVRPVNGVGH